MSGDLDLTIQKVMVTPKVLGGAVSPQFNDDLIILGLVALNILNCVVRATEPGDTTKLWYDISSQSATAPGILKAYSAGSWSVATNVQISNNIFYNSSSYRTIEDISSSSGALSVDFTNGHDKRITLTESITSVTVTGGTAGQEYKLYFVQGSGSYTVSGWGSNVVWFDSLPAPNITATDEAKDVVQFDYDGSEYLGSYRQNAA